MAFFKNTMKKKILNLINTKTPENIIFAAYLAKANNIMPDFWSIIIRDRKIRTYRNRLRLARKLSSIFSIELSFSISVMFKVGFVDCFDDSGFEFTSWINYRINNLKSYMIIDMYYCKEYTIAPEYIEHLKKRWA